MKLVRLLLLSVCAFIFVGVSNTNASVDFNCYCNNGSVIPAYYPILKKINTADFDSCHQECANLSAKYFSFSTVSHAGVTRVTKGIATQSTAVNATPSVGSTAQITNDIIPGTLTENTGIIRCGRAGQSMCTLCDLIAGMNRIIKYLMKLAIGVALLAMTIGGAMYIISAGDKGLIDKAKGAITNAAWGFVIIFAGFLIINTTISYLGAKTDEKTGESTFGMNITSWGQFDCNANPNR